MRFALLTAILISVIGCGSKQPIKTASYVDIERFMGKWYVIANIPTFIERDAYNPVEIYQLNDDGKISTTFRFNKGDFDGEIIEYHPVGTIIDKTTNAVWHMQFIWPIQADYRILYVDDDYHLTIIGRAKRDHAWIMARDPDISEATYQSLLEIIREQGYDTRKVEREPHRSQPITSYENE